MKHVGGQISSSNLFLGLEPQKWALAWMGRKREELHQIYRVSVNNAYIHLIFFTILGPPLQ